VSTFICMKRDEFLTHLGKDIVLVFFTSTDCTPCKTIKPYVQEKLSSCPYVCLQLDRNIDADVYAALQSKKQVKGVPSLLAYAKDNRTLMANLSISGTNQNEIDCFFESLEYL
jgi:thiol-disulfide isomerase/thioredoxin